jgi:hypothetical protein
MYKAANKQENRTVKKYVIVGVGGHEMSFVASTDFRTWA